jgi:alkylation response protein AidB-like acyl-CoA dehydrogenase
MQQASADPTAALLAGAAALAPLVAEHRAELARGPDLPVPIARALEQAGLTRLWLPRALGGPALPPPDYLRVIEAVARHDGAVGWCAAIAASAARLAGLLAPAAAAELFGGGGHLSGSVNPAGTAEAGDGGWHVAGRWSWGSFIRHSRVVAGMCVEQPGGGLRLAFLPTGRVRILDTWNAGGLRATGSHDFVVERQFVPEAHTVPMPGFAPAPGHGGALSALPFVTTFTLGLAPVPLGIARAAIDALVALAAGKVPAGSQAKLCGQPGVQADVARAETTLRAARAFLFEAVEEYWSTALAGGTPNLRQRALVRMACWNAAQAGKQVVDRMYTAAGGTATDERAPFAAQLRDVHAVGQHLAFATRNMETAGRILLDMEAGTARF